MKRSSLWILLFIASCSHEQAELFDKKYASLCDAFDDISKYAASIHINASERNYNDIRKQAVQNAAKDLGYTDPIPSSQDCADIEALKSSKKAKDETTVYHEVLSQYMQTLDPHSLYLGAKAADEMEQDLKNVEKGTGIEFRYVHRAIKQTLPMGHLMIDYVYPDTDAYNILKRDDEVESINGEKVEGKLYKDINAIVDKAGGSLDIKVKRLSETVHVNEKVFKRTPYYSQPIDSQQGQFLMVRIPKIVDGLAAATKQVLLKNQSNQGLILDLRGDLGGSVDEALAFLRLLIGGNDEAFYTVENFPNSTKLSKTSYKLKGRAVYTKPIVILVDSDTASSAEVISSVLQQRSRAIILGSKTFGKGSVQTYGTISEKSGFGGYLITTTSLIYYSKNETHQISGVKPNYKIDDPLYSQAVQKLHDENISMILHETDYRNPIYPTAVSPVSNTSALSAKLGFDQVDSENDSAQTCKDTPYDTCLKMYAVQFLQNM